MNGAGRRPWDFSDSTLARTHAQSRAELESPRAREPCTAGSEFFPATALRTAAPQSKRTRSRAAYAAAKLMAEHLAQPQPPEGMGVVSCLPQ